MTATDDRRVELGRRYDQGLHGHAAGDREAWIDAQLGVGNDAAALLNGDALADVVLPTPDGASSVLPRDTVRAAPVPTDPEGDSRGSVLTPEARAEIEGLVQWELDYWRADPRLGRVHVGALEVRALLDALDAAEAKVAAAEANDQRPSDT